MKKLPVSTIALTSILILNVGVMIISGFLMKNSTTHKKYVPSISSNSEDYSTVQFFEVKKGNVTEYSTFSGTIGYEEDAYSIYKVSENNNFQMFDEVSMNQELGEYESSKVLSTSRGRIVAISKQVNYYEIKVFNYDSVYVNVGISYASYYTSNIQDEKFSMNIGEIEYNLIFDSIDLYSTTSSDLTAKFLIEDNNLFLSEGYSIDVKKVSNVYKDVFYIDNCYILDDNYQTQFKYIEDGTVKTITIYCEKDLGNGTVIISSLLLNNGMKIYA